MLFSQLTQRLNDLGCKPCHVDRLLRGWSQVKTYDRKGSPAATFFPAALRAALPGIEAELEGLARLHGEYPTTLSPALKELLANRLSPQAGKSLVISRHAGEGVDVERREVLEQDEVARLLVELADGQMVESVLLPRGGLCISTQVGCAVGCVFCMSGRDGLQRQLSSLEMVAQVVLARRRRAVSKVVFMGMGEPAHNLDNVLEAIHLLGMQGDIAHKNLVLSTVGDVRVFERLMPSREPVIPAQAGIQQDKNSFCINPLDSGLRRNDGTNKLSADLPAVRPALALSLHSTDDALRAQLLPNAPRIPVEELVARCEEYARATHYPTQYQWTLIEGVNDSDAELERIIELLSGKYAIMNFIPFNDVEGLPYRRPAPERLARIVGTLKQRGIITQLRDSAGQDVEGACGQLRARAEKKARNPVRPISLSPQ